jgi:enoyl-CoA hydratase/carnithine racemase
MAAGAGAVIALAADFRVCTPAARFAFLFTKVGLSGGDMGAAYLLPRLVGLGHATRLLMLGDTVSAEEASQIGLVSSLVPPTSSTRRSTAWPTAWPPAPSRPTPRPRPC